MIMQNLLQQLERLGIRLKLDEQNNLTIRGQKSHLAGELLAQIKNHKADIIEFLTQHQGSAAQPKIAAEIPICDRERDVLTLSSAQQRLWFIDQVEGGTSQYNITATIELEGDLSIDALKWALEALVSRHEVLRTTYTVVDGSARALPHQSMPLNITEHDLSGFSSAEQATEKLKLLTNISEHTFNLEEDLMIKVHMARLSAKLHIVQFCVHHIAADGWSIGIIIKEFCALYREACSASSGVLPEPKIQYLDFANWQNKHLSQADLQSQIEYWQEALSDLPQVHNLPLDCSRPAVPSFNGGAHNAIISRETFSKIQALCKAHNVTLFMFLQSTFAVLLSRYSNESDIVIGSPTSGRDRTDLESLIGCFASSVIFRHDLSQDPSFLQCLAECKTNTKRAFANQDVPFEKLVEVLQPQRSLSHSPLFQILLTLQNYQHTDIELPELNVNLLQQQAYKAKFELELFATERDEQLHLQWIFSTDILSSNSIARMSESFMALVEAILEAPNAKVSTLAILKSEERNRLLVQWNYSPSISAQDICLQQLFHQSVGEQPNRVAVIDSTGSYTYLQIWQKAKCVADMLILQRIPVEALVTVRIEKSHLQLASTLGIMMAGAAYLPMERSWPNERCRQVLNTSGCQLVLTDHDEGMISDCDITQINVLELFVQSALPEFDDALPVLQRADNLAYVIFTSGSTGTPKGVAIEHRSVVNTILDINERFSVTSEDRVLVVSALSFDLSVYDLFGLVAVGGTVVFPDDDKAKDPAHWMSLVEEHGITIWDTVPVSAELLVEQFEMINRPIAASLRHILMSGDWIPPSLPARLKNVFEHSHVHSLGGATEGSIWSIHYPIIEDTSDWRSIPYGRPLSGQAFYILDKHQNPVPQGVCGELYIGGRGVAREYFAAPELTQKSFIWSPKLSQTIYRTGDTGRYLPDGNIEFMGRLDHQVKLRGFRVELGEVEVLLNKLPYINNAIVRISGSSEAKCLVAYVVCKSQQESALSQFSLTTKIKQSLATQLPDYMIPVEFIYLDNIPLTANGKVDTKALPKFEMASAQQDFIAPTTSDEIALCEMWQQLLGLSSVGVRDDFFQLGGHSLLAIRFISQVRQHFDVDLDLKSIFRAPTIAELAVIIKERGHKKLPTLCKYPEQGPIALSPAQRRLWFIDQFAGGTTAYNMTFSFTINGELDIEYVAKSLRALIDRHDILRTKYKETHEGEVLQWGEKLYELPIQTIDLRDDRERSTADAVEHILTSELNKPFDLSNELSMRMTLILLPNSVSVLGFAIHHIASDGWSMDLISREFSEYYNGYVQGRALNIEPLEIQYSDYVIWQKELFNGSYLQPARAYWANQLEAVPSVHGLILDQKRPSKPTHAADVFSTTLSKEVTAQLHAFCLYHGVTVFMCLESVFSVLLSRYSNETDIVIGSPISGRDSKATEELIGLFVNTIVLRNDLSDNPSFDALLSRNKNMILDAFEHKHLPFEQVLEIANPERSVNYSPLVQILFSVQNQELTGLDMPGLTCQYRVPRVHTCRFDIELTVSKQGAGLHLEWLFNTEIFHSSTIARMAGHFDRLLSEAMSAPDTPILNLPLLNEQEIQQKFEWNQTQKPYSDSLCIHELFEHIAVIYADRNAVTCAGQTLSYRELNERANQLARYLRMQVSNDKAIGLCLARSTNLIVSIWACFKVGQAYVPLEPSLPAARLESMATDAGLTLILTQSIYEDLFPQFNRICIDRVSNELTGQAKENLDLDLKPNSLAYMIFTSGSTGRPKGVMIEHQSLVNRIQWMQNQFGLQTQDTVLHKTPYSFDVSVWELTWPFIVGARLVVAEPEQHTDLDSLIALIQEQGVSHLHFVPSMLGAVLEHPRWQSCDQIQHVFCSGESLPIEHAKRFYQTSNAQLHNLYGPTEATIDVSYWPVPADPNLSQVLIGKPIQNTSLLILNNELQPVPVGVYGELHIGGCQLARGYINQPELTADKFVKNPTSLTDSKVLYKTGDWARVLSDGNIEFLGRIDNQVKLRGLRIELEEIESQLMMVEDIADAKVMVQSLSSGQEVLAGYLKVSQCEAHLVHDEAAFVNKATARLQKTLPAYMVPTHFALLDSFPLTTSGKVDRRALESQQFIQLEIEGRRTGSDTEKALIGIFERLLGGDNISVNDNFYSLGGDSIISMQVVSQLRALGYSLTVRDIVEHQSVAQLLPHITKSQQAICQNEVVGMTRLLPIQTQFLNQRREKPSHFNQSVLLDAPKTLNLEHLKLIVLGLLTRHDALRQTFSSQDEKWVANYSPIESIDPQEIISSIDFSDSDALSDQEKITAYCEQQQRSLDIFKGRLIAVSLITTSDKSKKLFITVHHLAIDGVSWRVLLQDLEQAWVQINSGSEVQLAPKTTSLKVWTEAAYDFVHSHDFVDVKSFWVEALGNTSWRLPADAYIDEAHQDNGVQSISTKLSKTDSSALIQECNEPYRTQPNELLLAALLRSYQSTFSESDLTVQLEGHGRDNTEPHVLSDTVGWFTAIYPIKLSSDPSGELNSLITDVKEQNRRCKKNGNWSLFASEQLTSNIVENTPNILFNYLGQFDNTFQDESAFTIAKENKGAERAPEDRALEPIAINLYLINGELNIDCQFDSGQISAQFIARWMEVYEQQIKTIAEHCILVSMLQSKESIITEDLGDMEDFLL